MSVVHKNINIPDSQSNTTLWIQYHKTLKEKFGAENALTIFSETWKRSGNLSLPDDADFDAYFTKQGINVKTWVDDMITTGRDAVSDVGDMLTVGKWILYTVIGAAVVGVTIMLLKRPEALAGFATSKSGGRNLQRNTVLQPMQVPVYQVPQYIQQQPVYPVSNAIPIQNL